MNRVWGTCGTPPVRPAYTSWKFQEERERERSRESIWRNNHWKFPNLLKNMNINIQEVQLNPRKINKETHGETYYDQTQRPKKKESWKQQERNQSPHIRYTQYDYQHISHQILWGQRQYADIFEIAKENNCQPRILYLANCPLKVREKLRYSQTNQKLRESFTTISALQEMLQGVLQHEIKER